MLRPHFSCFRCCRHILCLGLVWALPLSAQRASGHAEQIVPPRIAELRAEVARHDDLYFRQAAPEITDYEYDLLKAELRRLERAAGLGSPERIGLGTTQSETPLRHGVPMLSLTKVHSSAALAEWLEDLRSSVGGELPALVIEPKYDGVAVSVTLHRGELVQALSRGNGEHGDEVTDQLRAIRGVAYEWAFDENDPRAETIELRGEVYLSNAAFENLNARREAAGEEPFRHPRSVAAGAMQLSDLTKVSARGLEVVFHGWGTVQPADAVPASMSDWRDWLGQRGLPSVGVQVPVAAGASTSEVERAVERAREQATALAVPTDGLVLKVDEVKWQARLGNGPLAPRWAVARKFSPPGGTTTLRRVVWEVGRLGTLTPVAEFDAVKIDGTQVRRASLHHAGEVRRRDLHVGDRIDVAKAGKIIPVVARVWADERQSDAVPVVPPEHCPVCDAGLEQVGDAADNLRCPNFDCAEQRKRRLQHFASKRALAIRGLGPGMAEKLIAHNLVRTPADLYRLNTEQLTMLPGVGERTAEKLVAAIAASREQPRWRLLAGVGMPGIGPESARQLAAEIGALRDLLAASDIAARESPTAEPWREPHWRETIQALVDAGW